MRERVGFTIIEVVLVLAIVGLIMVAVFIALPTLQASQRDAQRKQDLAVVIAGLQEYKSRNSGQYPTINNKNYMYGGYHFYGVSVSCDSNHKYGSTYVNDSYTRRLLPYFQTVCASGLSNEVVVYDITREEPGQYTIMGFNIGTDTRAQNYDVIYVVIGLICNGDAETSNDLNPNEQDEDGRYVWDNLIYWGTVTRNAKDVAVFRYLEKGWYTCRDVG